MARGPRPPPLKLEKQSAFYKLSAKSHALRPLWPTRTSIPVPVSWLRLAHAVGHSLVCFVALLVAFAYLLRVANPLQHHAGPLSVVLVLHLFLDVGLNVVVVSMTWLAPAPAPSDPTSSDVDRQPRRLLVLLLLRLYATLVYFMLFVTSLALRSYFPVDYAYWGMAASASTPFLYAVLWILLVWNSVQMLLYREAVVTHAQRAVLRLQDRLRTNQWDAPMDPGFSKTPVDLPAPPPAYYHKEYV